LKTLLSGFYDSKGIIYKEFVLEVQIVTCVYYLDVIYRFWKIIQGVRPEYQGDVWFLLYDNALAHRFKDLRNFLVNKSKKTSRSANLTDLECDSWLFLKLKLALMETCLEHPENRD